ncbi:galactose-1-epimerase, partial [Enterococcus faecium]
QTPPVSDNPESFGDVTLEPNQVREFVTEYKINIKK